MLVDTLRCINCGEQCPLIPNTVWICSNCQQQYPLLGQNQWNALSSDFSDAAKDLYDDRGDTHNDTSAAVGYRSEHQQNIVISAFAAALKNRFRGSILDLGCGHGRFARSLIDRLGEPESITGIDLSAKQLSHVKSHRMHCFQADASSTPFLDGQFDIVYSAEVIQYVKELEPFLLELSRITKLEGSIFLSTLHSGSFLRRLIKLTGVDSTQLGRLQLRSPKMIQAAAAEVGLRVARTKWLMAPLNLSITTEGYSAHFTSGLAQNILCELTKS